MKYSQTSSTLFCQQDLAKHCNFKLQAEISSKEQEYGGDMGVFKTTSTRKGAYMYLLISSAGST